MGASILLFAQRGTTPEGALSFALELARRFGATLVMTEHADESLCPAGSRGHRDVAQQDTAAYAHLEWLRQEVRATGRDVSIRVLHGELPAALHQALTTADLLIALDPDAGEDLRRRSRMLALEAACQAGVPALALPAGWRRSPGHRLLLAFDGSSESRAAFPLATGVARALGWSILLLQVIPLEAARLPRHPEIPPLLRRLRAAVRRSLQAEAEALAGAGLEVAAGVMVGSPVSSLLRAARLLRAGMIVLGSSGRGTRAGGAPGSVATAVFLRARVPCLVVPWRGPAASLTEATAEEVAARPLALADTGGGTGSR